MQLLDAAELPGQIPARTMEIEHRRCIRIGGRPPPGVHLLDVGCHADGKIELAHARRHAAEPDRILVRGPERELALPGLEADTARDERDQRAASDQQTRRQRTRPEEAVHQGFRESTGEG